MLCFSAARAKESVGLNIAEKVAWADVAETGGTIIGAASCSNNSNNSRSRSRSSSGNISRSDIRSSSNSHRSSSRNTRCSRTAATAAGWRSWWWWWLGWRTAAMERHGRGYGGSRGEVRYRGCRWRAVWGRGRGLPSYFLPSGGNICFRYSSNLLA